ncbi:hypothetical protein K1719_041203 [Acacia pycnantha]|nr:hypothetical protein K1719_041203 [Acacia pycnantha]
MFDFEFSNMFDHVLYPKKFVGEIERTLKRGGVCVLHVTLSRRPDKYSANDLYTVQRDAVEESVQNVGAGSRT